MVTRSRAPAAREAGRRRGGACRAAGGASWALEAHSSHTGPAGGYLCIPRKGNADVSGAYCLTLCGR